MKSWKWWHIVALILELAGLAFLVLCIATGRNDDLFLPAALVCISAGNLLSFVMNLRQNRKDGK